MIRFLVPVLLLFTFSCSRQNQSASRIAPVFDPQVRNAVNMGDGDLEVQALRKRLLENPTDTMLRRRLAAKFKASGYPDLELEHLRIAFELAPADLSLGLDLANALNEQRLSTQANQVLAAALKDSKPTAAQWSSVAILTDSIASLSEGEALHRKALSLDTNNFNFSNNLAYNLIRQNRSSEAEQILRELLRAKPTHELARNNLAKLYATQLNQPEEALLHWKAISGPAAAHNNLAAAYIELGKWAEAKIELEKALALRFQFPEALQNLQIIAARTGGTVDLNLDRDKKPSSLSKLARALRHVFVSDDDGTSKSNHHRSRS